MLTLLILCGWAATLHLANCQPSCCRAFGMLAIVLLLLGFLLGGNQLGASHPSIRTGTLFFELDASQSMATQPADFNLTIDQSDGVIAGAHHYPVLLLPAGSYARLAISAYDAAGIRLLPPVAFALGPDDHFPWAQASSAAVVPGRRLRGRIMMRGGFGGAARSFSRGVGSFSSPHRGTASRSFYRRPSTGTPAIHGTAHGTPPIAQGVPVAHGYRPGYHSAGSGHHDAVGGRVGGHVAGRGYPTQIIHVQHTPIMHDVMAGLMVSHVLRHSSLAHHHHHHHHQALPPRQSTTAGGPSLAPATNAAGQSAPTSPEDASSYYFGAAAIRAGTRLQVVPAAHRLYKRTAPLAAAAVATTPWCAAPDTSTGSSRSASSSSSSSWPLSRESCGLTAERMLPTAYDRYVLVSAALRLPTAAVSGGRWPIVLRVHPLQVVEGGEGGLVIEADGTSSSSSAVSSPPSSSVSSSSVSSVSSSSSPRFSVPLIGLQQARPDHSKGAWLSIGRILQRAAQWVLLALVATALLGLATDSGGGAQMRIGAHSAQPVSARQATAPPVGADGELLGVGTRVQSEWSRAEGGDGMWYAGTVVAIYPGAKATVEFDDGELWTGALSELYALRGEDEEAPPHMAVPAAVAVAVPSGGEVAGASAQRRPSEVPLAVGRLV